MDPFALGVIILIGAVIGYGLLWWIIRDAVASGVLEADRRRAERAEQSAAGHRQR